MAMRLATERAILGHGDKLCGKSSNHALMIHMGMYDELTPMDWLNDPYMVAEMPKEDQRTVLERKFNLV